jgi:hypothetical protein
MSDFKRRFWLAALVFAVCLAAIGWIFTNHATITFP